MTEGATTMEGPVGGDASAGALLRKAREKQGLHLVALAASIKVTPRKLEMLEADRHDELHDAAFTRALAQAVCRVLKIDPAPVLALLPESSSMVPLDAIGRGINRPFRARPALAAASDRAVWARPAVWLLLLLAGATALVWWWPEVSAFARRAQPGASATAPASAPRAAASAPSALAPLNGVVREPVVVAPATAPATLPPGAVTATLAPVAAFASAPSAAPILVAADKPTPPPSTLQLRSSQPSWVEVQDSGGKFLISRVIDAGESVDLDGSLPLRLRIGNAPATQVVFRGQAIDLARHTRNDNLARLELK